MSSALAAEVLFFQGGSPRIYAGEERFSAPENRHVLALRFSAGPQLRRLRRDQKFVAQER